MWIRIDRCLTFALVIVIPFVMPSMLHRYCSSLDFRDETWQWCVLLLVWNNFNLFNFQDLSPKFFTSLEIASVWRPVVKHLWFELLRRTKCPNTLHKLSLGSLRDERPELSTNWPQNWPKYFLSRCCVCHFPDFDKIWQE